MNNTIKMIFVLVFLLTLINTVSAVSKTISVNVIETRNISLFFTQVNNIDNFDIVVDRNANFLRDTYPISDNGLNVIRDNSGIQGPENISTDIKNSNKELNEIRRKILSKVFLSKQKFTNVIGVVRDGYLLTLTPPATGVNFNLGKADVILVDESQLKTTAHEVSHTFELCDEYSNNTWNNQTLKILGGCPNGDFNGDGNLDSICISNEAGSGCPTQTFSKLFENYGNINDTKPLRNFMGGSDIPDFSTTPPSNFETWISNNSYNALLDRLNVNSDFKIPEISFIKSLFSYIIVRIFYEKNGTAEILDAHILEDGFIHNESQYSGNFTIEVLNESGEVISNISFEPEFTMITENGSVININRTFIIFALPLNNQTPSKVVFKNLTFTIAEVNRTPNTPTINLTSPMGGETFDKPFNITWDSTDLDNDTINYAVLISSDNGTTFSALEVDYPNTTLLLNTSNFANSHEYKIKILATDGINTGNDTTNTFTISNPVPPIVTLVSPLNDNVSSTGNLIFNCSATDFNENLKNINLYHNISGVWAADETKNITGSFDYETFTVNNIPNGNYIWNCLAYDNTSLSAFANSNFTVNVNVTTLQDIGKFFIKNSSGNNIAWFGDAGNIVLKGILEQSSNFQRTPNFAFVIRNNGEDVLIIENNGSMYIDGTLSENQAVINSDINRNDFRVKDSNSDLVINVNETGYLFLKGNLIGNKAS